MGTAWQQCGLILPVSDLPEFKVIHDEDGEKDWKAPTFLSETLGGAAFSWFTEAIWNPFFSFIGRSFCVSKRLQFQTSMPPCWYKCVFTLGVCAAETIEGKDLGMAEGGYAVQAWTLRHAAQEERGRGRHVGVHGVGAAWGPGESGAP